MPAKAVLDPKERSELLDRAGDRIRKLRNELGLTLSQFATAVGYTSHSQVSAWQDGACFPKAEPLLAMHRLSGKTLAWILGLSDAPERDKTVTLSDGTSLTDAQVNEALAIRLNGALQSRMRQNDEAAMLLRRFWARKRALHVELYQRRVLLSQAIALFVEDTVRLARLSDENKNAWRRLSRIERFVSHQFDHAPELLKRMAKLGPSRLSSELARIAKLGASLVETEIEYDQFKPLRVEDGETGRTLKVQEEVNERIKTEHRRVLRDAAWAQFSPLKRKKPATRDARKAQSS